MSHSRDADELQSSLDVLLCSIGVSVCPRLLRSGVNGMGIVFVVPFVVGTRCPQIMLAVTVSLVSRNGFFGSTSLSGRFVALVSARLTSVYIAAIALPVDSQELRRHPHRILIHIELQPVRPSRVDPA